MKAAKTTARKTAKQTPMMAQFLAIKAAYPHALLFYRMGDFYELFHDDAKVAAPVLDIVLTNRGKSDGKAIPMAGVPVRTLQQYLKKALDHGFKVAICEQMEAPNGKGPVRREVVRVVSSGTVTEEDMLTPRANNFLVAIAPPGKNGATGGRGKNKARGPALAALDLSTGQFQVGSCDSWERAAADLSGLKPVEILVPEGWSAPAALREWQPRFTRRGDWEFDPRQGADLLMEQFQAATLAGFGIADSPLCQAAAGAMLAYCQETQRESLGHVTGITRIQPDDYLILDDTCRRNLEINQGLVDGDRRNSLLGVLDITITAMGGRLLAQWINHPLSKIQEIRTRQESVGWLLEHHRQRQTIRDTLKGVHDLERLLGRIALNRAGPRDLAALRNTLSRLPELEAQLMAQAAETTDDGAPANDPVDPTLPDTDPASPPVLPSLLTVLGEALGGHESLRDRLAGMLADDPPQTLREGGVIREGVEPELDRFRELALDGKGYLATLEKTEREETGIPNLKIKHHRSFGYSIEVTNNHLDKVPYKYQQRQTMTNAIRYVTPELKEYEEQIFDAEERMLSLEARLFDALSQEAAARTAALQRSGAALATLDVLAAFAETAEKREYRRPQVDSGSQLDIIQGRHPVVEALSGRDFVPNDTHLNILDQRIALITGPNMSGKSTYMRQTALIALMAHTGSYVPAQRAEIGLIDRIFTRVGAGDDLAGGQSTFMVEMTETARILHNATPRSLIILDEIGRGTATFDGLSIAWAVIEHIYAKCGARTLFATHYHELTELEQMKPGVVNYCVEVKETLNKILFLHTIIRGAADRSYGIHVAELAGLPRPVIKRARAVLAQLEEADLKKPASPINGPADTQVQLNLFQEPPLEPALRELKALDPDDLSPKQALETLYRLKNMLR